ncbi:MAG TPA: hypothetical protein VN622_00065 [Clostridia bacterium]|nr:hypothetical protein [Clostridia bacterium]
MPQVCQTQQVQQGPSPTNVDLSRFLPPNATLVKQLRVDFGDNAGLETVLAYASESGPSIAMGIRVLKNGAVVFEESDAVINGVAQPKQSR